MAKDLGSEIRKATEAALSEVGADPSSVVFAVEWPTDLAHGDYAVNAAMAAAKALGKNPRELADELASLIKEKLGDVASVVEVAGPGFINITLAPNAVAHTISIANSEAKTWGTNESQKGKRVILEFSCPNPFKEMHIGHMMSTIIGEALSRLTEASGATVARDTYGGDVGPHVAKALWGLRQAGITEPVTAEEIGTAYAAGSKAYEEDLKAKEAIDDLNVSIYKGDDHELMELWRKGKEVSLEAFRDLYRILDTHFDYYFFESESGPKGLDIVKDELARGIFEESEGAIIYKGEKIGLHTLVFVTSRGTPTYEAKDIGLAFLKEERWPSDEVIITTAAEQIGHFRVFLAALTEIAPLIAEKMRHVPHGFLRLASGKMSSREGNVITAAALIKDVIEKTSERNEDPLIAEQVALGAIKYSILKSATGTDIVFDFDRSLSLEGDSGPYLQYALARAKSILRDASKVVEPTDAPASPYTLERLIMRFPEVIREAQENLAPHTLVHYLTQLAGEWNSFYAKERIIGGKHEAYKLRLTQAFVHTMQNGLHILGIPVPETM